MRVCVCVCEECYHLVRERHCLVFSVGDISSEKGSQ